MSNFPGLCIGGPMDGKLYESPSPSFQMSRLGQTVNWEYHHMPTDVGVHFWVLKGETPKSALTALAVHYMTTKALET